jgi:hypothetical protein
MNGVNLVFFYIKWAHFLRVNHACSLSFENCPNPRFFFSPTSNRKVLSHWTGLHGPARDLAFLGKTIEGFLGLKELL